MQLNSSWINRSSSRASRHASSFASLVAQPRRRTCAIPYQAKLLFKKDSPLQCDDATLPLGRRNGSYAELGVVYKKTGMEALSPAAAARCIHMQASQRR